MQLNFSFLLSLHIALLRMKTITITKTNQVTKVKKKIGKMIRFVTTTKRISIHHFGEAIAGYKDKYPSKGEKKNMIPFDRYLS